MGKITVEIEIKTFGTPLYGLSHPSGGGGFEEQIYVDHQKNTTKRMESKME